MEILSFTLSGKTAMFKVPEVNAYYYFTYGQIHKPAVLGILGAILGYAGYNSMEKGQVYPAYYEKLKNLKISIAPNAPKGYFTKKITSFNNSVGYASQEKGGNLIVKEQWLENPSWNIHIKLDNEEAIRLSTALLEAKCAFIPYLGKNDHPADITDIVKQEGIEVSCPLHLNCLFPKKLIELDLEDWDTVTPFRYEEALPAELSEDTNLYVYESFVYTNLPVIGAKTEVFEVKGTNLVFY